MASVAPTSSPPGKVLIIGAGVTGLLAGHLLKQKKIEFEIIEATARWGGRIKDADGFADFPVALGAEWCHSLQVFPAKDMFGIFACCFGDFVLHDANCPIFEDITAGQSSEHLIFPDQVEDLNELKAGKVEPADATTKHLFNMPGDNKFHSSSWVRVFEDRILPSVRDCIVYESPVTEIDYEGEKVTVKTSKGTTFKADKVVICVPISILVKEKIAFSPVLPKDKVAAIKNTQLDPGLKVFMEFTEKFYPHFLLMKPFNSPGLLMYMDETVGKTTDKHILCLIVLGTEPYQKVTAGGSSDEAVQAFVLSELDGIFDGKASKSFVKCVVQNWETEPFIECGGPASTASGFDPVTLAKPVAGKVFFAGDSMNPVAHNNLFVQGACETAYAAVREMAK